MVGSSFAKRCGKLLNWLALETKKTEETKFGRDQQNLGCKLNVQQMLCGQVPITSDNVGILLYCVNSVVLCMFTWHLLLFLPSFTTKDRSPALSM